MFTSKTSKVIPLLLLGLLTWSFGQESYEEDWSYKTTLTLNTSSSGADISGSVQNIPILVRLNNSNFVFASAQANGEDLRFVKNGVSLSYEIEHWDASGEEASVWVLMDEMLGNNSSQSVSMYWGNEEASAQSNGGAVFDTSNGFTGAWHFNEDPNGDVSDVMKDRTGTEQHLTPYGGMTSANSVAGVVGKAIDFDGVDDYLDLGTVTTDFTQGISICAWVNYDTFYRWTRIADFGISDTNHNIIFSHQDTTNILVFSIYSGEGYGTRQQVVKDSVVMIDTWSFACASQNVENGIVSLYHNGIEVGRDSNWNVPAAVERTASYIAKSNWSIDGYLDGTIDEMRVSNVARSSDWVKLSYESQKVDANWITMSNPQVLNVLRKRVNTSDLGYFVHNGFSQLLIPNDVNRVELYNTQGERIWFSKIHSKKQLLLPKTLSHGLLYVKYYR